MPPALSRTYGKNTPVKRKILASDGEIDSTKRRKVTPSDDEQEPVCITNSKPGQGSPPPRKITNSFQSSTPTKMTKRMLGRSKTELSIESQPSTSVSRTSSLPVISSSSSQPLPEDESLDYELRPNLPTSTSTPRVKRTYAGHSRSFLVSLPVSNLNSNVVPGINGSSASQEDDFYEPESYSSLRLRWGVDNSEDDPPLPLTPSQPKSNSSNGTPSKKSRGKAAVPAVYLPPNMMNPLKSITELRSKGESRRFLDEVGYLFEGMDSSNSIGLKRSSASEITTKLCDDEFARKAKAADFYHKTWDIFLKAGAGRGEDKVLDILLVFFITLVSRNPDTLFDLANQEPSTSSNSSDELPSAKYKGKERETTNVEPIINQPETLIRILFFLLKISANEDPLAMVSPLRPASDLDFKSLGLSKKDKTMLSTIYSTISTKSNLFPPATPITTTLLITHILRTLPPSLFLQLYIADLLHSLRFLLYFSFPPNEPFDGTCPSHDDHEDVQGRKPQYACIQNHLHLLDMYLSGQWSSSADDGISAKNTRTNVNDGASQGLSEINVARDEWFVDGLIAVGVCAEIQLWRGCKDEDKDTPRNADAVSECLEILLRVLVNLTHDDSPWARSVALNKLAVPFMIRLVASSSYCSRFEKRQDEHDEVKPKLVFRDSDPRNSKSLHRSWDRLCLALGLLTNLAQSVQDFNIILRRTKISPKCTLTNPACTEKCACPGTIGSLQVLAQVYNFYFTSVSPTATTSKIRTKIKRKTSPSSSTLSGGPAAEEIGAPATTSLEATMIADTSLILGALSILFGLLMVASAENQNVILSSIGSNSDSSGGRRVKLESLVDHAKEFVVIYDAMTSGRVESSSMRKGDEGEMKSAKEVLRNLEQMRDDC